MMVMIVYNFFALLLVAIIASACAFYFNKRLANEARRWEEKRHIVITTENFCDRLMKDLIDYWAQPISMNNYSKMVILATKILSFGMLVNRFVYDNFSDNENIKKAREQMIYLISGDNFVLSTRCENAEKVDASIIACTELRLAIIEELKAGV